MSANEMPPDLTVRVLRAKAAELEAWLQNAATPEPIDYLAADIALIASALADFIDAGTFAPGELHHVGELGEMLGPGPADIEGHPAAGPT